MWCGAEARGEAPEEVEKTGFVQPGEERAQGRPFAVSKHLMGGSREDGAQFCSEVCSVRTKCNGHKSQHGKFQLGVGKPFSPYGYTLVEVA